MQDCSISSALAMDLLQLFVKSSIWKKDEGTWLCYKIIHMMMSSNGNIFCIAYYLCGEFTATGEFPKQLASDAELCCSPQSAPE